MLAADERPLPLSETACADHFGAALAPVACRPINKVPALWAEGAAAFVDTIPVEDVAAHGNGLCLSRSRHSNLENPHCQNLGSKDQNCLQWGRSNLVDRSGWPKIRLLNRDSGNILSIFQGKTAKHRVH